MILPLLFPARSTHQRWPSPPDTRDSLHDECVTKVPWSRRSKFVFGCFRVTSETLRQPLQPDTGGPLHDERVTADGKEPHLRPLSRTPLKE